MSDKRVLIVGATDGHLRGAANVLERAGYDVAVVTSPELLESFTAGKPPDLVIIDEVFGDQGGVLTARHLRENPFWRMVSMMLAVPAGEQHLEECLVSGINDFILAPFPEDELLDKVKRLTVIPARREVNTLVRIRPGRADGSTVLGKTLNVSPNGILVEIETLLPIGRDVDVEFFLPDDPEPIRLRGRVIRRAAELDLFHPAFGIRFDDMPEDYKKRVSAYVHNRERAAGEGEGLASGNA